MIPNAEMIEEWAVPTDDGYVKIPASSWPELLWVLKKAEEVEARMSNHDEGTFPIALKVSRCANGETYEYTLMIAGERAGTLWMGAPTVDMKRQALFALLGGLLVQRTPPHDA